MKRRFQKNAFFYLDFKRAYFKKNRSFYDSIFTVLGRIDFFVKTEQYQERQFCIKVFLIMLFIIIKKNMKQNRLQLVHKNRLALSTKSSFESSSKLQQVHKSQKENFSGEMRTLSLGMKQKLNKKISQKINLKIIDKIKEPLKLKSITSTKINYNIEKFSPYQIFLSNQSQLKCDKEGIIEQQMLQIIDILKKKMIIMQKQSSTYIIKKDNLFKLLYYIMVFQRCNSSDFDFSELSDIRSNILIIFDKIKEEAKFQKQLKMSMNKNIVNIRITEAEHLRQTANTKDKIQKLLSSKMQIEESIKSLQNLKQELILQIQEKQKITKKQSEIILELKQHLSQGEQELARLHSNILLYKDQLQKVDRQSNSILNYVNNQNNKLIQMASQQYKNIESEIYQYASYLQCNQLASSIEYQPINIVCITENLEDQIKNINRMLIQNEEISFKDKSKAMRDFLLEWMNKFKKKDTQMKQLMDFKTKCVHNFVQKMKKWLDNWTLKQQFLVNLRKQFCIDNGKINQIIQKMINLPECQANVLMSRHIKEIYDVYRKIQNNYKLGNSFY